MASRHVALLRGVNNAGVSPRVAMADLKELFEGLGFRDVRTLLNSGNVVFSAPGGRTGDLRGRIQKALAAKLGISPAVIVLSRDEVIEAARKNPLADVAHNPSWLLVVVLSEPSDRALLKPLLGEQWAPEQLAVGKRVAYLWCAKGVAHSPLWAGVERALRRSGTARNIGTITKLRALLEADPA